MGSKEVNETPAAGVGSSASITLLQERFKHLQSLKDLREKRGPLRLINKAPNKVLRLARHDLPSRYVVPCERQLFGVAPTSMLPLSLSLGRNEPHDEFCHWRSGSTGMMISPAPCIDLVGCDDDVDTSLHL